MFIGIQGHQNEDGAHRRQSAQGPVLIRSKNPPLSAATDPIDADGHHGRHVWVRVYPGRGAYEHYDRAASFERYLFPPSRALIQPAYSLLFRVAGDNHIRLQDNDIDFKLGYITMTTGCVGLGFCCLKFK
jgi:hypothetical protein